MAVELLAAVVGVRLEKVAGSATVVVVDLLFVDQH